MSNLLTAGPLLPVFWATRNLREIALVEFEPLALKTGIRFCMLHDARNSASALCPLVAGLKKSLI